MRSVVAIASTAHLDTQGVALNSIARKAITSDPDWQGGDYYGSGRTPDAGLALARQIGHITYLSKHSLRAKFPGDRFAVESYLTYQGEKFVARFDANTYLLFSRALTRFDLPLDWQLSEGFRLRVLRAIAAIPYGETRSYTEMASTAGNERAVRAAGTACGRNPIPVVVPCHRVLRSSGGLGGYGGGLPMKQGLLQLEGVLGDPA